MLPTPTPRPSVTSRELIRSVRQCKTSAEERALIAKESAAIRASLREDEHFMRHRNVAKLMYMHMLGYPTHFGQMECVKLIATAGFPEKRVGYLGLMILLDERQEVTMLVTNSIKNDLGHKNHFIVGLALCALGNICTAEMARDVAPEVAGLLNNRNSYVRKKAALCAIRVVNKVPELAESFLDGAEALLADRHHGVLLAAVTLILRLCDGENETYSETDYGGGVRGRGFQKAGSKKDSRASTERDASNDDASSAALTRFRRRVPDLVKILRALLHGAYSAEHDVGGQHDPFLQVKLLRLLRVLGAGDAEASDLMSDCLANVASNVNAGKNAGAAVLYEAVRCVVGVESVGGLRVLAVNVLGRFLADKDNNVRYVALNALAKVVGAAGADAQAVQRHRRTIVECVKDGDVTIRRSALNLVYSLVNASNVQTLVPELLDYLEVADLEFKADVAKRVANLCSKFAPSDRYRVDAFVTTLVKGGAFVARDECRSFLALLTNRVELQPYATRALFRAAHEARDDAHFPLIGVACWALGEYGDVAVDVAGTKLAEEPPTALTARDVVDTLRSVLADARAPQDVRRVAMVALAKLAPRFSTDENIKKDCVDAVSAFRASLDLEMQQRSAEFDRVFRVGGDVAAATLERVPPMALRDEVGASASSAADLRMAGAAGGVSDAGTADLLGDLLGDVGGGATAANAASGADLLGDLLGDVGGGGGAPLFPSGGAPPPSADPLADLMGGSPLTPGPGAAADPLADLMGGVGAAGGGAPVDPMAGLSLGPGAADLLGSPAAPAPAPAVSSAPVTSVVVPALDAHGVSVAFSCAKPNDSDATMTTITASYANANAFFLRRFTLRAAVPKSATLALEPASGGDVSPNGGVVTQVLNVVNPLVDSKPLAMRLQVTWSEEGGEERAETATVTFPSGV
jgi:AP-1 complex subunit gamma-1